jgi:ribosomal protein S18 acetylase RimI-like enzyme
MLDHVVYFSTGYRHPVIMNIKESILICQHECGYIHQSEQFSTIIDRWHRNVPDMTRKEDPFYISPLTADLAGQTARVYTDLFPRDEPLTHARSIDPAVFYPLAVHYLDLCAKAGMSFVVQETGSPVYAGFLLASDVYEVWEENNPHMAQMYEIFSDCITLISRLEHEFLTKYPLSAGEGYHIVQIGVVPQFRRRGLAKRLIIHALEYAKFKGYRVALAECTSRASRNCFLKSGFSEFYSIAYKTYCDGKTNPYSRLAGEISLMVKWL